MTTISKRKNRAGRTGIWSLFPPAMLGVLETVLLAFLLSLSLGRMAYETDDPFVYTTAIGVAALYVSSFLGGFLVSLQGRKRFEATVLHALFLGIILLILPLTAGGLSGKSISLNIFAVLCSLVGGTICHLRIPSRKKPRFKGRGQNSHSRIKRRKL